MDTINKATEELKRSMAKRDDLAQRGRQILRKQTTLLCQALHQLKRRRDAGQVIATKIWDSLVDGIIEVPNLFTGDIIKHFWNIDEDEDDMPPLDMWAFRMMLEEAGMKLNQKKCQTLKNNGASDKDEQLPLPKYANNTKPSSYSSPSPSTTTGKKITDKDSKKALQSMEDRLLSLLIEIVVVASAKTDIKSWEWTEENTELKMEMELFNRSLRLAMDLFEEMTKDADLETLVSAMERMAVKNEENLEGKESLSSDDEDGDEDDDDEFTGSETESEDTDTASQDSPKKLLPAENSGTGDSLAADRESSTGTAAELQSDDSRSKDGDLPGSPAVAYPYPAEPCNHAGYPVPSSHYRDWKRDGYRCICGLKFPTLNAVDRHITNIHESRVIQCAECDYRVGRRCCMDKHVRDNHDPPVMMRATYRRYQCQYGCGQVFKSKCLMFRHQKATDRQCKNKNASPPLVRPLTESPTGFVEAAQSTLERANLGLTRERLDKILAALSKDNANIRESTATDIETTAV